MATSKKRATRSRKAAPTRAAAKDSEPGAQRRGSRRAAEDAGAEHAGDGEPAAHAGPRSFWSGTLTFGLVSVPVDLFPAARSEHVALRMLGPEGQPLARRYFCSTDQRALEPDDIVRGYERDDGSFTVISDEELEALAPRKSRDIDLRRFVQRADIPPELLERPYILAPAGDSTKAYHLLAATMERTGRAGIATFVMRGKEYLAAIFAEGGILHAATMRFADELRTPADVGLPAVRKPNAEARREIEAAVNALAAEALDESLLRDADAAALRELAQRKHAAGRDVVEVEEIPGAESLETAEVIDIMSVLRERMAAAGGEKRGPARAEARAGARAEPSRAGTRAEASRAAPSSKRSRKKSKRAG